MSELDGLKHCSRCSRDLSFSSFHRNAGRRDGLAVYCKDCANQYDRNRDPHRPDEQKEAKRISQRTSFQERYATDPSFRERVRHRAKRWYDDNREHARGRERNRKYQLEPGEYEALLASQGGVCAICRQDEAVPGKSLAVDHCHETGEVRGILCSRCNAGIGFLGDTLERVAAAHAYLRRKP